MDPFLLFLVIVEAGLALFFYSYIFRRARRVETERCPVCQRDVPLWNLVIYEAKDWLIPHMVPPRQLDYFVGLKICRTCAGEFSVHWQPGERCVAFKKRASAVQEESLRKAMVNLAVNKKLRRE